MRISDWSSDVCSSDLRGRRCGESESGADRDDLFAGQHPAVDPDALCDGERQQRMRPGILPVAKRWGGGSRSEEHTSELQSLMRISYAVFCLKKKKNTSTLSTNTYYELQSLTSYTNTYI